MHPPVIHWFRRDLRLSDNTALHAALQTKQPVLPVYILSNWKTAHRWTGSARQQFLCNSLASLNDSLEKLHSRLLIRSGNPVEQLRKLCIETGATAIYTNRDPDPFGRSTEEQLAKLARELGIKFHVFKDHALHEQDEVLTATGTSFRVFTPYSRAWAKLQKLAPLGAVGSFLFYPQSLPSLPLPTLEHWNMSTFSGTLPEASEPAAHKRLSQFLESRIIQYANARDLPAEAGTSRISQDLRFGLISIRTIYKAVYERMQALPLAQRQSLQVFINELCWREFYFQTLWKCPEVLEQEFTPAFRSMPWLHNPEAFERWTTGQTGFPIVDAGMRQLFATGYMHNRVRMITAMFLTKDLHLDWRQGEQWFMQHLIDGEIASNNGGWQWSAGTGTDAAPYFRIQNPWTQSLRYDPDARYIKRWIPELEHVPAERLHKAPAPGLRLVKAYPLPMLDHAAERDIALTTYKEHLARSR